jgi:hypothetical protein
MASLTSRCWLSSAGEALGNRLGGQGAFAIADLDLFQQQILADHGQQFALAHVAVAQPGLHTRLGELAVLLEYLHAAEHRLDLGILHSEAGLEGGRGQHPGIHQLIHDLLTQRFFIHLAAQGFFLVLEGLDELPLADAVAVDLGRRRFLAASGEIGVDAPEGEGNDQQAQDHLGDPTLCAFADGF